MAHDVFISYAEEDKPIADAACAKLESEGIRCWIASRDAVPGKDWGDTIIRAITGSQVMVLIFSSSANKSVQIKREVNHAIDKGLPLIPFRIENVEPTGSLEYYLDVTHWLDAIDPPLENQLGRLAETIKRLLKEPGTPPFRSPAPVPRNAAKLWIWCGAGLLAIILMIFAGRFVNSNRALVATNPPTPTPLIRSSPDGSTPVPNINSNSSPGSAVPSASTLTTSPTSITTTPLDDTDKRIRDDVEVLGNSNLAVVASAIYELGRLAKTSKERHLQIVQILTAHIRAKAVWQEGKPNRPVRAVPEDIKAAVAVLAGRTWWFENGETERLDLRYADLRGVNFSLERRRSHFEGVRLNGAHLEDAILMQSNFRCADLTGAYVSGIDVNDTDFAGADIQKLIGASEDQWAPRRKSTAKKCSY